MDIDETSSHLHGHDFVHPDLSAVSEVLADGILHLQAQRRGP